MRGRAERALAGARRRARVNLLRVAGRPVASMLMRAQRASGQRTGVALVYHRVDETAGDLATELLPALASSLFDAQLRHLTARYRVVCASELVEAARARKRGEPFPIAITFDDDLAEHARVVAPILQRHGAVATFFLTGTSLDRPYRFWWERLQVAYDRGLELHGLRLPGEVGATIHEAARKIESLPPNEQDRIDASLTRLVGADPPSTGLRADDVRGLLEAGSEIGFHTRRHRRLTSLADTDLEPTLREGRQELEAVVGGRLATIAYPHGRADERVAVAAEAAGYDAGFTGRPGAVTPDSNPLLLPRVSPSYSSVGELAFDIAWTLLRGASSR